MTDGDFGLIESEAAQWDAIVSREWPIETAVATTQRSSRNVPSDRSTSNARQRFVTVYQPRRPRLTPLAIGAAASVASAWLAIKDLNPAFHLVVLPGISRHDRVDAVHDLTVAAVLVTIALAVATGCLGIWTVSTARYRLRRSACRLAVGRSNPTTVYIRPPNPATAAAWILLLLFASAAAGWWIALQLGATSRSGLDAIEAVHLATIGAFAWLAVFLMCSTALATWAARESRHRLRCNAIHGQAVAPRVC